MSIISQIWTNLTSSQTTGTLRCAKFCIVCIPAPNDEQIVPLYCYIRYITFRSFLYFIYMASYGSIAPLSINVWPLDCLTIHCAIFAEYSLMVPYSLDVWMTFRISFCICVINPNCHESYFKLLNLCQHSIIRLWVSGFHRFCWRYRPEALLNSDLKFISVV